MQGASELEAMQYHLLVAEFDALWSRPAHAGQRERMDRMIRMIDAYEARAAAPAAATALAMLRPDA